jgi:hypothetical protein
MNRLKNFEQHNSQFVNEEFLDNLQTKIMKFLQDPTNDAVADKLLQQSFIFTFNNSLTKHYKKIVHDLPLKDKIKMLEDVLEKLEYSPITALRLVKSKTSDKLYVGSIKRQVPLEVNESGSYPEGPTYKAKLKEIIELAQKIYDEIEYGDLPAWVQDHITEAKVCLDHVEGYHRSQNEK